MVQLFKYDGIQLAYDFREGKTPSKLFLLFIHGFYGSHRSWAKQMDHFDTYDRMAVDLPGFGQSSKGPELNYGHGSMARALHPLLQKVTRSTRPVHVVGNGFGGRVAVSLALQDAHMVHSMTLAGATLHQPSIRWLFRIPGTTLLFRKALHWYWGSSEERFKVSITELYKPVSPSDELLEERWARFKQPDHLDTVIWMGRDAWQDPLASKINEIEAPCQLLWGREDPLEELELAEEMHRTMPKAQLDIIDNCGQFPHEQCPARFNALLEAFLSKE